MKLCYQIVFLLLLNTHTVQGQSIDFSYTTPNNLFCSPQIVTFTASTPGTPGTLIWDFGDGLSGGAPVEYHLYDFPGTYEVTLTAVYANTASSVKKTIVINPRPDIGLTSSSTNLCQPGNVTLNATSLIPVTNYQWFFGDGSPGQTTTSNSIPHNFTNYGNYNVFVVGTTQEGCTDTTMINIVVQKFPLTVAINPSEGCLPANSTLTATTSFPTGDGLQNITWNFGDQTPNATTTGNSVTHQYNTTNPITGAKAFVTSNQGCTNEYTLPRFAFGIPPTNTNAYTIAQRDTFCGSETIQFYGFADSANLYRWEFGDGITETTTSTNISHKYSTLGDQQVIVTPFYNGCAGPSRTLNIHITGVIALYDYTNTCSAKNVFQFNNNSLGTVSAYRWTYSDMPGFIENGNYNPVHTFPTVGSSIVKLAVFDNVTGCSDSLSTTIYTAIPTLTATKSDVCRDSSITYTVTNSYPAASGFTYEFHVNGLVFDNSTFSTKTILAANNGTFDDYVVIKDGITGTCDDTLHVGPIDVRGPVLQVVFPDIICQDTAVTFTNNSFPFFPEDNIVKWRWDFGDGQKDSVRQPQPHAYQVPGLKYIKLEATDINDCMQLFESYLIIAGLPNLTVLPAVDTICLGESATLAAYTSYDLTWTNSGLPCADCDTITVTPTQTTQYIAMAMTGSGCKSYDTAAVKVYSPINLAATPNQATICPGEPVQLNLNVAGKTTWFPPTYLNNAMIQNPVSRPDEDIIYKVRVEDEVGCFSDSAEVNLMVYDKPQVDAGPDQMITYNTPFTLSPVYSADVQSYSWTPATGLSCPNCPFPTGTALRKQTYTIEITDGNSCKAKDSVTIFIGCEKSNLLLPNAFTPNGDGLNDIFYPIARGYQSIKSFTIFNRNGIKVFERKDFQPNVSFNGWDGRIKGGITDNTQSYVWVIEGICDTGMSVVTKGSVILIK